VINMKKINSPYAWAIEPNKYEIDRNRIIIFDTTLRDGEQSPGSALNVDEKVELSKCLIELGVDAIEAGFPISSPGDFAAVKKIADTIAGIYSNTDTAIFGLARALDKDILACYEAVKNSKIPGIHTFIATSDQHIEKKFFGKTKDDILAIIKEEVSFARRLFDDNGKKGLVEFSPEDAGRTNKDFLYKVCEAAIESGANIINIPDTVGYTLPWEYGDIISGLMRNVKNINRIILSVHCHNDLGLATANSLSAIKNGALQVECTVNGIGERAGNASLEEVVMAIKTRKDIIDKKTNVDSSKIYITSKLVSAYTGYHPQRNKAIVGANSLAHEAGIHQDGVIKSQKNYEIIEPKDVGWTFNRKTLGRRSGQSGLFERLNLLGYDIPEDKSGREHIYNNFIAIADKERKVTDSDLIGIMKTLNYATDYVLPLEYVDLDYTMHREKPKAKLIVNYYGKRKTCSSYGNGPVDAAFAAMKHILGNNVDILTYNSNSIGVGSNATARAEITIRLNNNLVTGEGYSTDIVKAAVISFIDAVNEYKIRTNQSNQKSL